jgi:hypothetical protein
MQAGCGTDFTTDHPLHRVPERTLLLEGLLGSADQIVVDL